MEALKKLYNWVADVPPEPAHIEFDMRVLRGGRKPSRSRNSNSPGRPGLVLSSYWRPNSWLGKELNKLTTFVTSAQTAVHSEVSYWLGLGDQPRSMEHSSVIKRAVISRLLLLLIQLLGQGFLPSHNNDGFKTAGLDQKTATSVDKLIDYSFGGFANWDGQYFLHVVTSGYTHENTMAFFPLFPWATRLFSNICYFICSGIASYRSVVLVTGWIINTWCFQAAAVSLNDLVPHISGLKMRDLTTMVVYLFCYNPASIFFSAFYSESMFAWLTFTCVLSLYRRKIFRAALCAGLSTLCRSNGVLNFGFIVACVIGPLYVLDKNRMTRCKSWLRLLQYGGYCVAGLLPFLSFQYYCIWKFCGEGTKLANPPAFCDYDGLPYTYIQGSNWDVGFLKYFQIRQIPNFLLATPVLFSLGSLSYGKLQLFGVPTSIWRLFQRRTLFAASFPLHGLFLTIFCFLCIHVQVSTRMILSACPYLYVYIAERIHGEITNFRLRKNIWMFYYNFIQIWFIFYFIIGTLAFTRGFPWT